MATASRKGSCIEARFKALQSNNNNNNNNNTIALMLCNYFLMISVTFMPFWFQVKRYFANKRIFYIQCIFFHCANVSTDHDSVSYIACHCIHIGYTCLNMSLLFKMASIASNYLTRDVKTTTKVKCMSLIREV